MIPFSVALFLLVQESKLSRRCIARRAGIPYQSLYRFMRGETTLTVRTADKLLKALTATCELKRDAK